MTMSRADEYFQQIYDLEEDHFGVTTVAIRRPGYPDTTTVLAVVEFMHNYVIDRQMGTVNLVSIKAFIIRKENYLIDGQVETPRKGDVIIETINGTERLNECVPYGNLRAVEEEFADGTRWLIRTKEVAQ